MKIKKIKVVSVVLLLCLSIIYMVIPYKQVKLFGIDENSLKVMGGIVLILMAISMVSGNGTDKKSENEENKNEELSVIPLGIPIAFGTGLFTTIIIVTAFEVFSAIIMVAFGFAHLNFINFVVYQLAPTLLLNIILAVALQFPLEIFYRLKKSHGRYN